MRATLAAALLLCAVAIVAAAAATERDVVLIGNSLAVPGARAAGRSLLHGGADHDEDVEADEDAAEVRTLPLCILSHRRSRHIDRLAPLSLSCKPVSVSVFAAVRPHHLVPPWYSARYYLACGCLVLVLPVPRLLA